MSILSCNICKEIYNDKNKRPLSLPCGNIYCEECIKNLYNFQTKSFLCPNHKIYHQFKLNNIPICAQVYEYLKEHKENLNPNNNSKEKNKNVIYCSRHPNNKIKFFCKNENLFLCLNCAKSHSKHNVNAINIDKNQFKEEIKELKDKIEEEKEKFFQTKYENEKYINKVNNHIEEQIKKIREYFSSIIDLFEIKKQHYINIFREIQEKFQNKINEYKKSTNELNEIFDEIKKKIIFSKNELYPKGDYEKFYNEKMIINSLLMKITIIEKKEDFYFNDNQIDNFPYYNIPKEIIKKISLEEKNYFGKISKNNSINNSKNNLLISENIIRNKYLNMSPVDEKIIGEDEKTINNSTSNVNNNNSKINLIENQTPSYIKDSLESTYYKRESLNVFEQNLMSDLKKNKTNCKTKKDEKKNQNLKSELSYVSPEKSNIKDSIINKDSVITYSSSTNNIQRTIKNDINEKKEKIYKPHLKKNPYFFELNSKLKKEKINTSIRKFSFNINSANTNININPTNKNIKTINTTEISNINSNLKRNKNISKTSRNKKFTSNSPELTSISYNKGEIKKKKGTNFNHFLNLNNSNNCNLKTKEIKRISSQIFRNRNTFKTNIRYKSPQDCMNNSSIFYSKERRHNSYYRYDEKTIG